MKVSVKKILSIGVWISIFLGLVLLFTLLQFPSKKIANNIHGHIQMNLDSTGLYIIPNEIDFSVLKGLQLTYTRPTLELPDLTRVQLDEIVLSPSFLLLFQGIFGIKAQIKQGAGEILLLAGQSPSGQIKVNTEFQGIELSQIGVFSWAGGLKGKLLLGGTIEAKGYLSDPSTLNGNINLEGKSILIEEQNLFGFSLPEIKAKSLAVQAPIESGKILFKNIYLGQNIPPDDLVLKLTGDLKLARNINSSPLTLKIQFSMSENVQPKFMFLQTLFPKAKQADGSMVFNLGGTLFAPMPI